MAAHEAVGGGAKERTGRPVWPRGRSERAGQNQSRSLSRCRAAGSRWPGGPSGGRASGSFS